MAVLVFCVRYQFKTCLLRDFLAVHKITDGESAVSEAARAVRVHDQEFITVAATDAEAQKSAADAFAAREMADEAIAGSMAGVTASVPGPGREKGRTPACWCGCIRAVLSV